MDKETKEYIDYSIQQSIVQLKLSGIIKDSSKSAFEKTEELLKNYPALKMSNERRAKTTIRKIEQAFDLIKDDPYFEVIRLFYVSDCTREEIAELYDTSVTTISRNKKRLVNKMKAALFGTDFVTELYS